MRLHPVLYLQTLTGIGFLQEVIPAPAPLVAAEQSKQQRADGQQVGGYQEVPQIQPGRTGSEGLEGEHAVAQSSGQRQQEDADAAGNTALGTVPAGQFANTGQNVFKYSQFGGEGCKYHEQEEQGAPQAAAFHVDKYGGHGVKQQSRAGANFHVVGEAGGEDDQACGDGNKGIQADDVDRFAQQGAFLAKVAAEDGHGADAQGQGEEGLVHSSNNGAAGDLGEIGQQVEGKTFLCAAEGAAADGQNDHQNKQGYHHVLGNTFQTALQIKAENSKTNHNGNQQKQYIHTGIGDHAAKAEANVLTNQELIEVVDHPAGYYRIEGHQADVAKQGKVAVGMPLLTGLLQFLVHFYGAGLGSTAHGKFHNHYGQAHQDQAQNVNQHETAAAVLAGQPGEFPNIAAANGTACAQQDEAQTAAKSFSVHLKYLSNFLT